MKPVDVSAWSGIELDVFGNGEESFSVPTGAHQIDADSFAATRQSFRADPQWQQFRSDFRNSCRIEPMFLSTPERLKRIPSLVAIGRAFSADLSVGACGSSFMMSSHPDLDCGATFASTFLTSDCEIRNWRAIADGLTPALKAARTAFSWPEVSREASSV